VEQQDDAQYDGWHNVGQDPPQPLVRWSGRSVINRHYQQQDGHRWPDARYNAQSFLISHRSNTIATNDRRSFGVG
jgi:hypothetical protein